MKPEELYHLTDCGREGEEYLFEAELNPGHPVFKGHFPGRPVMPGVCTIRLVRECVSKISGCPVMFSAIRSCKFLSAVVPVAGARMQVKFSFGEDKLQCRVFYCETQVLKLSASVSMVR